MLFEAYRRAAKRRCFVVLKFYISSCWIISHYLRIDGRVFRFNFFKSAPPFCCESNSCPGSLALILTSYESTSKNHFAEQVCFDPQLPVAKKKKNSRKKLCCRGLQVVPKSSVLVSPTARNLAGDAHRKRPTSSLMQKFAEFRYSRAVLALFKNRSCCLSWKTHRVFLQFRRA